MVWPWIPPRRRANLPTLPHCRERAEKHPDLPRNALRSLRESREIPNDSPPDLRNHLPRCRQRRRAAAGCLPVRPTTPSGAVQVRVVQDREAESAVATEERGTPRRRAAGADDQHRPAGRSRRVALSPLPPACEPGAGVPTPDVSDVRSPDSGVGRGQRRPVEPEAGPSDVQQQPRGERDGSADADRLSSVVATGDRRSALEAIRDKLALDLEKTEGFHAGPLARELRDVIREIDKLPRVEVSELDRVRARREAQRKAAGL